MNHKNKTARRLLTLCFFGSLTFGAQAAENNPALKALFDQANYWHEKSHDELAKEALQKVLMVDANNTQAMYLMALWAQQAGDIKGAAQWRERLAAVSPQDNNLQALDNAKQIQQIPRGQLDLARQQARSGNIPAALATWRSLFNGDQPPPSLAPEYYLTMAGDKSLYPQAVVGLRQFVAQNPQDNGGKIALGKVLTYQEGTRREGIDLLQNMASGSSDADKSLRQALLWLGPTASDETYYQTFLQRHPKDIAVQDHYRKSIGGTAKGEGFTALNSGNTDAAKSQFEQVLQTNPQDADALAGMGYIAQRKGDYTAASEYLNRAASLGGDQSDERKQQADDAAFYGQLASAQAAFKQGNVSQALALSAPLAQQSGERGTAAKLFRADVQRHNKDYAAAEQTLRGILNEQPNNGSARENLYYVLREQNKTAEAQAMLQTLPASLQAKLQPRVSGGNPTDPVRRQAQQAAANGDPQRAIAILQQGVARYPSDPWLRLDLARQLQKQGNSAEASNVMAPSFRPNASNTELYAGALFASENNAWQQSQTLLSRIPASSQTSDMRALAARVNYNLQMSVAERYLAQGDTVAAANTLKALATRPPQSPADAGKLAKMLAQSGDVSTAVAIVRGNMSRGVQGNAGDYGDQIAVLNQAGLGREAQAFLASPELQSRSTPTQLASVRNGYVINEADQLRTQGNYAAAYDKLIRAMQSDPQNTDLMFAMARLYQSGKMNKEAGVVYDYLMTRDTPEQDARAGAIDVALASKDVDKAKQLAAGLRNDETPDRLLLLARVAEADGNHQQAMSYLRTARGKLLGLQGVGDGTAPTLGGLALADNPFTPKTSVAPQDTASSSLYGEAMPWQVAQLARNPQTAYPGTTRTDLPVETAQAGTLRQVDNMMEQLTDKTATWARGAVSVRGRDGESGLSKLTEIKAPLQWSTVPFGDSRLDLNVTPISLNAGSSSDEASRRFGTGAWQQGMTAISEYISTGELPNIDKIKVPSQGSQSAAGVELGMALTGEQYKLDVGSTPLGQDLNTIVGGVQWSPQLTDYLKLILTGERRAVTDSLLSYVGAKDKFIGKTWGQVTKNGGSAQLSYDDGDAGFYAGVGLYNYIGENVPSNDSFTGNAGVYIRPYRADDRELKTGISMTYMDFSKNLSYFSYGQGGYFSPQDYISVSFPVDYSQKFNNWTMSVGASLGYQSYSQDESPYFPTDSTAQSLLELLAANGFAKEAWYSGSSENGMGYNLRAAADYKVNKDMTIGGQVGYDTFGDYNESTAQLYFRYLLGNN
ncbi:cellulose biosynthesis protein BcsC [Buttiauxella sp. S04-F03]|uniref:cellulose biosynthesis protein BcsC n=1 Tax=Buttiauxella sp. S04-F03 TaxID=2904525 RepID=UPI001E62C823|nr:cellulose biosynthesis protein BcsC [Buttiauxella sp. S04-F03]MCE0814520.1 BCSC C-terminal domain-containing protein [Buttiauxella sp. S04-F03]